LSIFWTVILLKQLFLIVNKGDKISSVFILTMSFNNSDGAASAPILQSLDNSVELFCPIRPGTFDVETFSSF